MFNQLSKLKIVPNDPFSRSHSLKVCILNRQGINRIVIVQKSKVSNGKRGGLWYVHIMLVLIYVHLTMRPKDNTVDYAGH